MHIIYLQPVLSSDADCSVLMICLLCYLALFHQHLSSTDFIINEFVFFQIDKDDRLQNLDLYSCWTPLETRLLDDDVLFTAIF